VKSKIFTERVGDGIFLKSFERDSKIKIRRMRNKKRMIGIFVRGK